ncbi:uncharacterized protein LOC127158925 isoform X1 [Labeo rohita]|uniref:uncharacterized protein LOC127158925 isoform X1 n=2 Tax=Labeo rohita TaxID=84645 RepID=UPI0021E222CF|nr:uncharacterized protein LOC127158925 isoform X1 [Labeo rohita]
MNSKRSRHTEFSCRITTMNAVNAVLLFILVWTFSAVCKADGDVIVSCDEVTGFVGKEVTFNCSISLQGTSCCVLMYMFQYPNDSVICKEKAPVNPCKQRNSFTCSYTPTTAMTEQFRIFVQTPCGTEISKFTVDITGPIKPEINNEAPGEKVNISKIISRTSPPDTEVDLGSKVSVIAAVVGCFILIIIVIIIRNKKPNFNNSYGFQNSIILDIRHDEDNNDHPEDVINDSV